MIINREAHISWLNPNEDETVINHPEEDDPISRSDIWNERHYKVGHGDPIVNPDYARPDSGFEGCGYTAHRPDMPGQRKFGYTGESTKKKED